jgi:hypothetical protein
MYGSTAHGMPEDAPMIKYLDRLTSLAHRSCLVFHSYYFLPLFSIPHLPL